MGSIVPARQRVNRRAHRIAKKFSPLAVLQRGYAIAQDKEGRLLREAASVTIGDPVRLRLAKGRLDCRVEGIVKDDQ